MDTDSDDGSRRFYAKDCPSRTVVDVLANKWVLYLLSILEGSARPLRFTEIRCRIDGITQKSLTQALRNLERDGLVSRTVYPAIPPHVEYALTDLGLEAGRLTTQIAEWSRANAPRIVAARDHHAQKPSAAFGSPEQR